MPDIMEGWKNLLNTVSEQWTRCVIHNVSELQFLVL